MRLVKFDTDAEPLYLNPEHVVAVRKALRNTMVETVSGSHTVREDPAEVARKLGADEPIIDVTPRLRHSA